MPIIIPPVPTSPFVDIKTGMVNRDWYLFLLSLFSGGSAFTTLHGNNNGFSLVNLSTDVTGTLPAPQFPALSGDVFNTAGATLITVSSNVVTNAKLAQMPTLTVKGNNTGGTANALDLTVAQLSAMLASGTAITNSLGGFVTIVGPVGTYATGPSVAQGASGVWFASGTVSLVTGSLGSTFLVKLWDGTTVIASAASSGGTVDTAVSVSGFISAPAGNIRISVADALSTDGVIAPNNSGNAKDSTVTAIRIS